MGSYRAVAVIAGCCLVAAFEGIDLQAPGLTVPVLGSLFGMSASAKGLFLSASTFGLIIGAALGGRLSDLLGRKSVLIVSVSVFGLLTLLTAYSNSAGILMIARFVTGIGLGGALPNVVALVTENVSSDRRSTAMGFLYASLPVGGAIASTIVTLASSREQWPLVYLIGGLAPLLVVPFLLVVLPDRTTEFSRKSAPAVATTLFGERRASHTLALWVAYFSALLTLYLLLGWLPSLMMGMGFARAQASSVQIAFNIFGALGSILTGLVLDRTRKGLTVAGIYVLSLLSLAFLAAIPALFALAFIGGGLIGASVSGTQTVLYTMAPACYPSEVRGTGVGFAVAVGRMGSAAGPLLAGFLIGSGRSPAQVLTALIPLLAVSGIAATSLAVALQRPTLLSAGGYSRPKH